MDRSDPRLPTGRPPHQQSAPPHRYRPAGGDGASASGGHRAQPDRRPQPGPHGATGSGGHRANGAPRNGHPGSPPGSRPAGRPGQPGGPPEAPPRQSYGADAMPLLTHDGSGDPTIADELARRASGPLDPPPPPPQAAADTWRTVRRILVGVLAVLVVGPALAFLVGYLIFETPNGEVKISQVATFTFADGSPLATVKPDNVNRVTVGLDQVPEHVRRAVFAAEDRSFESNRGFDVTGIARAAWNQLQGGIGGGSTITQQYVKVSTGDDSYSLWRKYKEVVLAVKVTREQSKDQILENYLNLIYFGRGAYGIQAASRAYFDKDVSQLTVSEGAMLAGLIQSPSRWDPAKNPAKSAERWNFVLDGMAQQGWINPAERASQRFPAYKAEPPAGGGIPGDDRGHIYNLAKAELEQLGITETTINTQGLTIETTIDPAVQKDAVDAVTKVMRGQPQNLRTALVSIDPKTGAILAYYGGSNGVGTDYAQALRQPGSSFKPFVLAAALQGNEGVGLGTLYDGSSPQTFPGVGRPIQNSEGYDCGECSVKTAMTRSINTVFYRMALDIGPSKVVDAAHKAGIPQELLPEARGGIALGDQEVHPIDMASAFATLAADGTRHAPYLVKKVTAGDGRVLHDAGSPGFGQQAMPQQVARNVTEAMLDVASFAGIGLGDRPVAAKTGTVQLPGSNGQNKDAWTVGFTPQLSTAVWVGTDVSEPIKNSAGRPVYGRMLPGSIWQTFMADALRGQPVEQFSRFVAMGDPPFSEFASDEDGSDDEDSGDDSGDSSDSDSSDSSDRNGRGNGNGNNGNGNGNGGNRSNNNGSGSGTDGIRNILGDRN